VVNVVEDKVALVDREVSVVVVSKVDLVEVVRTVVEKLVNPSLAVLSKADLEVNEAVV
jgi:hypothetical protein